MFEVGKKYRGKASGYIYDCIYQTSDGCFVLLYTPSPSSEKKSCVIRATSYDDYTEYREPVVIVRYGRPEIDGRASVWSLTKYAGHNIKSTWTDGILTSVEMV